MAGVGAGGTLFQLCGLGAVLAVDGVGSILPDAAPPVSHDAPLIAGPTVFAGFASVLWMVLVSAPRRRNQATRPDRPGLGRLPDVLDGSVGAGLAAPLARFADIRMVFMAFTVVAPLAAIAFSLWLYPNTGVASVAVGRPA